MQLRPADNRRTVLRVVAAERVVDADQPAASLEVVLHDFPLRRGHIPGVTFVHHHDVGIGELLRRRKVKGAVDQRPFVGEELAPVGDELRIIVRPFAVGLQPAADVNVNGAGVTRLHRRRRRGYRRRWLLCRHADADGSGRCHDPRSFEPSFLLLRLISVRPRTPSAVRGR